MVVYLLNLGKENELAQNIATTYKEAGMHYEGV